MRILVTGAKGFVGKNLCWALKNIRDGKDRTRPSLKIDEVYEYDIDSVPEQLSEWCQKADYTQKVWEQMSCDVVFESAGFVDRKVRK